MGERALQLALRLFNPSGCSFDDFAAGENHEALNSVRNWSKGDGVPFVYLFGGTGCGKSHLAQAAIDAVSVDGTRAMYVPCREVLKFGPEILTDLGSVAVVAVDDIGLCAGNHAWELQLFALYNEILDAGGRLLWTGAKAPLLLDFGLQDLRSRLAAGLSYQLTDPDDSLKADILRDRARARGFDLGDDVLGFILRHERRDMTSLTRLLDRIDEASLGQARAVTLPLVRECLTLFDDSRRRDV